MTGYFCITKALRSGVKQDPIAQNAMIRLYPDPDSVKADSENILACDEDFNILDFNAPFAAEHFAPLLRDVQIYRLSLELLLDEALVASKENESLYNRLVESFGARGLPAMTGQTDIPVDAMTGDLRHPLLGHLSDLDLARVFVKFLTIENNDVRQRPYGVNEVIALNRKPFYGHFEGYALNGARYAKLDKLLRTARRPDYDPNVPHEQYMQRGQKAAENFPDNSADGLLKAWLKSDLFQCHRCEAIDQVLAHGFKLPPWVRADVFSVLEHEAMKQNFARRFFERPESRKMVTHCPMIKASLEACARGEVDDNLQNLLKETIAAKNAYAGAAEKFAQDARQRLLEAELVPNFA